jgi:16S rRNA (guanine966-N2)-methyltransferase
LRIIGGTFGSRTLVAPRGQATRPTSDRVREALFGILESAEVVENARVIDLHAGTGALALEALSRGAAHATLVESSREALDAIRTNVATLGVADRTQILAGDALKTVRKLAPAAPFDLVLADPPWALVDQGVPTKVLGALVRAQAVGPRTWVVLEHSARTSPPDGTGIEGLAPFDTRRYGDTALTFYKPDILVRLSS